MNEFWSEEIVWMFPLPLEQWQPLCVSDLKREGLSVRAWKTIMVGLGTDTLIELASLTREEVLNVKDCGQTTLNEIRRYLQQYSLDLKEE